jgi:Galactose oxidase, central domain
MLFEVQSDFLKQLMKNDDETRDDKKNKNTKIITFIINRSELSRSEGRFHLLLMPVARMPFVCSFSPWMYSLVLLIAPSSSLFGPPCIAMALHVEWTQLPNAGLISPRRSGHTAFVATTAAAGGEEQLRPFVFGGYVEVENDAEEKPAQPYKRFVTNDLWEWKQESNKWEPVKTVVTTAKDNGNNDDDDSNMPGPRLVAATAVLEDKVYLFGGWDPSPEAVQAGKFILDTVHVLDVNVSSSSAGGQSCCCWSRLPVMIPDGPISRHVAVSLPSRQQILIHSHRCQDYVHLFDPKTLQFTKQQTTGPCPSPRGLHAATVLHHQHNSKKERNKSERVVFFGGAAQDQTMSNEAFLLDTATWEWKKLALAKKKNNDNDSNAPSPRAAPCLCAISDDCVLLFGGATSTDTGLEPLQDLWALHVTENKWERLIPPPPPPLPATRKVDDKNTICCPPPRNAATLTPCSLASAGTSSNDSVENDRVQTFILTGGWAPFRQTWDDCYILHVRQ